MNAPLQCFYVCAKSINFHCVRDDILDALQTDEQLIFVGGWWFSFGFSHLLIDSDV